MIRTASQLTFCSPGQLLRRMVVERDEQGVVTRLFGLDEGIVESARTCFFDGIISSRIISVSEHCSDYLHRVAGYQYINLSTGIPGKFIADGRPLLLDFGTGSVEVINRLLPALVSLLAGFSTAEIIAACTYYPALAIGETGALASGRQTPLMLWEGSDLVNKCFTGKTQVRKIS